MNNKLLNRYLLDVNTYTVFKKRTKFFDRYLIKIAAVGLIIITGKMIAEWIVETLFKM